MRGRDIRERWEVMAAFLDPAQRGGPMPVTTDELLRMIRIYHRAEAGISATDEEWAFVEALTQRIEDAILKAPG